MEPCAGCGTCCKEEVCLIGKQICSTPPCVALSQKHGRYWCGVIENADILGIPGLKAELSERLGIGRGCDSTMDIVDIVKAIEANQREGEDG